LKEEENRDEQSIAIVLKRYERFLKKIFERYSNASKGKGRDTFDEDTGSVMSQLDLLKMFKEKNVEKNKIVLQEVYKFIQKDKGQQGVDYEGFLKFLEQYCVGTYHRDRNYTIEPMGGYLR
jgi:hypothetical protein